MTRSSFVNLSIGLLLLLGASVVNAQRSYCAEDPFVSPSRIYVNRQYGGPACLPFAYCSSSHRRRTQAKIGELLHIAYGPVAVILIQKPVFSILILFTRRRCNPLRYIPVIWGAITALVLYFIVAILLTVRKSGSFNLWPLIPQEIIG
jgi:hypothetical protein